MLRPALAAAVLAAATIVPAAERSPGNTSPSAAMGLENLARGRPYTLSPRPNYPHSTDPADATQLTDGTYTRGYFWTQKTTVGWRLGPPKFITIDLGAEHPIRGVSWSTAAGYAGVRWPDALLLFASPDGKAWYDLGDLVRLSAAKGEPPAEGYATHVFRTDGLQARGRYVCIAAIAGGPYVFVDEVEVFRGDAALLEQPCKGRPVDEPRKAVESLQVTRLAQAQFERDLAAVREALAAPGLAREAREVLTQEADALAERVGTMPPVAPEGFRAVLPMTDLERDVFRLGAAVWRAQGKPPLRLWKTHRWDPLAPSAEPAAGAPPPVLEVHLMAGERRADVLNLTSARQADTAVRLRIEGLPGGAGRVEVHEVLHVGTRHFVAVAAALPPARRDGDAWIVTVPAGMTRQVWFSFDGTDLAAGTHEGRVVLDAGEAGTHTVPLRVKVYPLRMPREKTLRLGGWSYTDGEGAYGITPRNRDAAIAHLRARHVNAPWAKSGAMPHGRYDAEGNLAEKPDTARFDDWVRRWPGAACYMVFVSVGSYSSVSSSFAGSEAGTPLFEKKVSAWIRFWAGHVRDLGLAPSQLGLLLVDEPNRKEQYDVIRAFAQVIRRAAPGVLVWEDACPQAWEGFDEMADACDVLVPNRSHWLERDEAFRDRFRRARQAGRQLGFYSCAGPARCFDPFSYYLAQQWHCFKEGATWSGFWAFGDTGGGSCWNEYVAQGNGPYCPLYLDAASVTPAKYMEAIADGVQDYEYLVLLRDRAAACEKSGPAGPALARAKELLAGACDRVLAGAGVQGYRWDEPKDRAVADAVRIQVLEALTALGGE